MPPCIYKYGTEKKISEFSAEHRCLRLIQNYFSEFVRITVVIIRIYCVFFSGIKIGICNAEAIGGCAPYIFCFPCAENINCGRAGNISKAAADVAKAFCTDNIYQPHRRSFA